MAKAKTPTQKLKAKQALMLKRRRAAKTAGTESPYRLMQAAMGKTKPKSLPDEP